MGMATPAFYFKIEVVVMNSEQSFRKFERNSIASSIWVEYH